MGYGHDPFEEPERGDRSHENDARSDEGREQGDENILERDNNDPLDLEPDDPEWSDVPAPRGATRSGKAAAGSGSGEGHDNHQQDRHGEADGREIHS